MAERKISQVSAGEKQSATATLKALFDQFCAFGAGQRGQSGMDSRTLIKFAGDCGLLDRALTRTDVDLIFTRVKLRGQRKLDLRGFGEAVRNMATKKRVTFHDLIAQAAAVGGPRVHADATKLADASQTRFHDDQGTYTGAHTSESSTNGRLKGVPE